VTKGTSGVIRAVVFDCFGVLYADEGLLYYQAVLPRYDEFRSRIFELDDQYDRGFVSQEEHDQQIAELTGLGYDEIRANVRRKRARNTALLDYIESLRVEYKVGLLSNIGRGGMDVFFDANERKKFFDATVLSGEIGIIKPDPRAFEAMAAKLGVSPSECVMIDDRAENCDGARTAGMRAVRYDSNQQIMRELDTLLEHENA